MRCPSSGGSRIVSFGFSDFPRCTYIFIIDDHTIASLHRDSIGGSQPALPEVSVHPSEGNLLLVVLANGDTHVLRSSQGTLVIAVIGFLDTQLLGITKLGALETEQLNLLVHPFEGSFLQFTSGLLEVVAAAAAEKSQNDELVVHDLLRVRGSELGDNGKPHGLHPRKDLTEVTHVLWSEGVVVVRTSVTNDKKTGPGRDLEALRQLSAISLDHASVSHETEGQSVHGLEIFRGRGVVIKVQEENLFGLFQLLETGSVNILNT